MSTETERIELIKKNFKVAMEAERIEMLREAVEAGATVSAYSPIKKEICLIRKSFEKEEYEVSVLPKEDYVFCMSYPPVSRYPDMRFWDVSIEKEIDSSLMMIGIYNPVIVADESPVRERKLEL